MRLRLGSLALLFILITSCQSGEIGKDKTVFAYNEINGLTSLDPAAASNFENIWPINQLFNGLMQTNESLKVVPCIARSYTLSPDGKTYTFSLRTDVYFHDNACFLDGKGRKVVARDFLFSFNRLYDGSVSSALGVMGNINRSVGEGGFEALNDSIFVIHLSQPFQPFISILTMKFFSVIPHEAIALYGADFRRNPVGTGPFVFRLWEEGNTLVLLKNDRYFERDATGNTLPYLDAVKVSFIKDKETAFMELLNGKFDMVSGADAFNANEVLDRQGELRLAYRTKFYLQKTTFLKTDYIGLLVDDKIAPSPLKNRFFREALNYAIDRVQLIRYLRNNIGVPAIAGFIPAGLGAYDTSKVKGYSYDPDKARKLMALAGYKDGAGLPEMVIHTTENYREQMEFIQSQLARCNINIQVSVEKPSVLRQSVNNSEYAFFRKSWFSDYADEENFMSLFYSKNFAPQGVNFFHFSDSIFDSLYDAAQQEPDLLKRRILYQRMDQIILEQAPIIPLYYDQSVRLVSHKIEGLATNGMNLLNLKTVRKKD